MNANGSQVGVRMQERKISTSVYLAPRQVDRLIAYSRRTGIPQAVVMREALDRELDRREALDPPPPPEQDPVD
jgi:hypothetical protein